MTVGLPESLLAAERSRVDAALAGLTGTGNRRVSEAIRYAIRAGGKRLRPILCLAGYRAFTREAPPAVYELAAAIELVHTYSLIHDDLPSMDDDALRRGRPSTHVALGIDVATAAGAALIPAAIRAVRSAGEALGLDDRRTMDMVVVLCRAAGAGGMVGGQLLDLEAEGRAIAADELERIHRLKTGALFSAAPVLGGLAAGAGPLARDALTVYGAALGLAFQVADDILDVTGSSSVLGKTAGRDTELEKATYPALLGLDGAKERAAREVETALAALDAAGIGSGELTTLAHYAVERDR